MNLSLPTGQADLSKKLLIDEEIGKLMKPATGRNVRMSQQWKTIAENPLWYGRVALRVAVSQAKDASEDRKKPQIKDDWEATGRRAESAKSHLYELLSFMAGKHFETHRLHTLRNVINHMTSRMTWGVNEVGEPIRGTGGNLHERHAWGDRAARELLGALETLERLAACAKSFRIEVGASTPNPGELEKNAFVLTMAEAWVFFTGRFPGVGSERNPFFDFANAAWTDAGGQRDQSYIQATKSAVQDLKGYITDPQSFYPWWAGVSIE